MIMNMAKDIPAEATEMDTAAEAMAQVIPVAAMDAETTKRKPLNIKERLHRKFYSMQAFLFFLIFKTSFKNIFCFLRKCKNITDTSI